MDISQRSVLKNLDILFVEDDEHTQDAIRMIFSELLKHLRIACTADEAMCSYKTCKPDIIVTDILLPGESGLEFVSEVRKFDKDTPVIVISGLDSADVLFESIEVQVSKYYRKPVNMKKLISGLADAGESLIQMKASTNIENTVRTILDISHEYYIVCDSGKISYANRTFLDFVGYPDVGGFCACRDEGCELQVIKNYEDEHAIPFYKWLDEILNCDNYETVVSLIRPGLLKSDAKAYIVRVNKFPNEDRHIVSFVDVTIIEREKEFFHNLAHKDPLTNTYNRMKFFDELSKESSRTERYGTEFALIMFDIDKFKLVNDTYGHQIGDIILKQVVDIVNKSIRTTDIFARYGGEEFIILAPETDLAGAELLAEKLRGRIDEFSFDYAGNVTCSFGVSMHKKGGDTDDSIRMADEALYQAKRSGRNKVVTK